MRHLAEVEAEHSTVLMVQVENETGLLGDSRDRSTSAEKAFAEHVPEALLQHLNKTDLHPRFKARFASIPASRAGPLLRIGSSGPGSASMKSSWHTTYRLTWETSCRRRERALPYPHVHQHVA